MNNCNFYGRISTDIELRYTQGSEPMAVAVFNIAVNRKTKDQKADFLPFVAFGKTAENIDKFFKKGNRINVRCHAQRDEYTDQAGNKKYSIKFVVDEFDIVESKQESGTNQNTQQTGQPEPPAAVPPGNVDGFMYLPDGIDEELPFD